MELFMKVSKRKRIFSGMGIVVLLLVAGYMVIRPFHLRWGASDSEISIAMPDDLNGSRWTRAVTVNAAPEAIWPWLVQWGQGRGGWYSYDWLENLFGFDIHTAGAILPEYQNPAIGDKICMAAGTCTSVISTIEPQKWFGWQSNDPVGKPVWSFTIGLIPVDASHTRLVIRESFDKDAIPAPVLTLIEIPDVVMELKALDTVKSKAEGIPSSPLVTAFEIIAWLAALLVGILAAIRYVNQPEWKKPLALGLLSICVLMILTFLYPPLWLRGVLDILLIGLFVWLIKTEKPDTNAA
jgi:hypothetical protein